MIRAVLSVIAGVLAVRLFRGLGYRKDAALDVVYPVVLAKVDQQTRTIDALDTKAIGILAAASLVLTVSPAFRTERLAIPWGSPEPFVWAPVILLALAGFAYLILLIWILRAVRPQIWSFPPSPQVLLDYYLDDPPSSVKRQIITDIAKAYARNSSAIDKKGAANTIALVLLIIEALTLTAVVIIS